MIRVAAFTTGRNVPNARFRVRQYIDRLKDFDINLVEFIPYINAYPPEQRILRPIWVLAALCSRFPSVFKSHSFDVTLLARSMISSYVTLETFTKRPRILDVDDAIWLTGRFNYDKKLASLCDCIICGNSFLANHFGHYNRNIEIIPTSVDSKRFCPGIPERGNRRIIGWSGSSSGLKYLQMIENSLAIVLEKLPDVKLRIICDSYPQFAHISNDRMEYVKWSSSQEVEALQSISVGIMPLLDTPWEQGKCSYKMLTYMSCGIPVVVSPVGMNKEILDMGSVGLGAASSDDWVDALIMLLSDNGSRLRMGAEGRRIIEKYFSIDVTAPKLADCLHKVAK